MNEFLLALAAYYLLNQKKSPVTPEPIIAPVIPKITYPSAESAIVANAPKTIQVATTDKALAEKPAFFDSSGNRIKYVYEAPKFVPTPAPSAIPAPIKLEPVKFDVIKAPQATIIF